MTGRLLALDIGSSSVRAGLYDEAGECLPGSEVKLDYMFRSTPDGGAEVDPDRLLELVTRAVDNCLDSAGAGVDVAAVATSAFWHGICGVDGTGDPTTPVLTWADRRCWRQAKELRARLNQRAVHARTGCVFHSSYPPAKLQWVRETQPETFARTARWMSGGEYVLMRLCGSLRVGTSMASATGLYDQNARTWDAELLDTLVLDPDNLSPLSDDPMNGLSPELARRWPALARVPWFPAAGDGACSNVGSGCTTAERVALMVGTSGALRVLFKAAAVEVPEDLWCYRADEAHFLLGSALSEGGNLYAWVRSTFNLPANAEFEAASLAPDGHGLTILPMLAGERGPGWSDDAHAAIVGLRLATRPVDILRAGLEAVALRFALVSRLIDAALPGEREVVATGGGLLHSRAWSQMMADALGKPVHVSLVKEASSRGAALLAGEALGMVVLEKVDAPLGETFLPIPENQARYQVALARQCELYDALVERF